MAAFICRDVGVNIPPFNINIAVSRDAESGRRSSKGGRTKQQKKQERTEKKKAHGTKCFLKNRIAAIMDDWTKYTQNPCLCPSLSQLL